MWRCRVGGLLAGFTLLTTAAASAANPTGSIDSSTDAGRRAGANPLRNVAIEDLSATRQRPLFSPSRRPPPPVVETPTAAPVPTPLATLAEPERPQLVLVGTVAADEGDFGIFLDRATNQPLKLRKGQDHNGWILDDVRPREVVLRKDADTAVLAFPAAAASAATAAASADDSLATERVRHGER